MKALEVVKVAAKAVVASISESVAPVQPGTRIDHHAEEELRRRAEVNARGAVLRGARRGWLRPRDGSSWINRRER